MDAEPSAVFTPNLNTTFHPFSTFLLASWNDGSDEHLVG